MFVSLNAPIDFQDGLNDLDFGVNQLMKAYFSLLYVEWRNDDSQRWQP